MFKLIFVFNSVSSYIYPTNIAADLSKKSAKSVNDEKTFEIEISAFRSIRDHHPKYLLTLDYDNANIEGIQKLNIIDWLLKTN